MAFLPNRTQPIPKGSGVSVLDLLVAPGCLARPDAARPEDVPLPDVEEVGQLGIMHVVEKWRVSDYGVHGLVRQVGLRGTSARQVGPFPFGKLGVSLGDIHLNWVRRVVNLFSKDPAIDLGRAHLERRLLVLQRRKDATPEECRE